MLKHFSSIWDYREFISSHKSDLSESERKRLDSKQFKSAMHKLKKLDVGLASDVVISSYSSLGRPARDPSLLIRSFILINHLGYTSIHKWCETLRNDLVLKYLIGSYEDLCVSNHYDLYPGLYLINPIHGKGYIKNRTSTERINNRVLNDYKLHQLRVRDLAKNVFFSFIACMNIHLDVWNRLEEVNT